MTAFVLLRDVRLADAGRVGGKAASLGELMATGVRVPEGIVLTADDAELAASYVGSVTRAALNELGDGPFAVRSSGLAEDGSDRSFAGLYESVLGVPASGLEAAIERCLASGRAARVAAYAPGVDGRMGVIVQRMVEPAAAGVALTADPISGERGTTVITAVRGRGERLVSGEAFGDEWAVSRGRATPRRRPEEAIDRRRALAISAAARRIAEARGAPQDVEWAIDAEGILWIVQARPMTGLPPDVSWDPPVRGGFSRVFRFGEWIPEPVTPLFESWLLTDMEARLHELHEAWVGQVAPRPHHVVVNGWYFYSLNFLPVPGGSLARSLPGILRRALRTPRRVAIMLPPTVRYGWRLYEREWRVELQPQYRAAVQRAAGAVETMPAGQLPELIDELASLAGEYFASIAVVAGSAYKVEVLVAEFYAKHLARRIGGSHVPLLAGLATPAATGHAVASLDWWRPIPRPPSGDITPDARARLVTEREDAERAVTAALSASPARQRAFERLLADAQHLVPVREEQLTELTLPWPVLRRAVMRIGDALVASGVIAKVDDAFFLSRDEVLAALGGAHSSLQDAVAQRRAAWDANARLVPPLLIGKVPAMLRIFFKRAAKTLGARTSSRALVAGAPASPGRATGVVRIVHSAAEFDRLRDGEILVAPLTAPAWTPLFTRAAAVVTDVGSALAHASVIAREYGIPAVVGCGDATARLHDGMLVTVDGGTGTVEPAGPRRHDPSRPGRQTDRR